MMPVGRQNSAVKEITQSVPKMADWAPAFSGRRTEGKFSHSLGSRRGHASMRT